MNSLKNTALQTEPCHEGCVGSLKRSLPIFCPFLIFRGPCPLLYLYIPAAWCSRRRMKIILLPCVAALWADPFLLSSSDGSLWIEPTDSIAPRQRLHIKGAVWGGFQVRTPPPPDWSHYALAFYFSHGLLGVRRPPAVHTSSGSRTACRRTSTSSSPIASTP